MSFALALEHGKDRRCSMRLKIGLLRVDLCPLVSACADGYFVQVSSSLKELAMPVDSRTQVRGTSLQVWVVSGPMACMKDINQDNQHCANLSLQKSLRS